MGAKNRTRTNAYVQEAFEAFGKHLIRLRSFTKSKNVPNPQVNLEGLCKVVALLQKEDREIIERFWGLTGGINHSKKMGHHNLKDKALIDLANRAQEAIKKMSKLELAIIYDDSVEKMINFVVKKVDKEGVGNIPDLEIIKYLMAFFIIVENGPKLAFERDQMSVEMGIDNTSCLDEYEALREMCEELERLPDQAINLSWIKSLFEMMDFKDVVTIRENFGINTSDTFHSEEIKTLKSLGIDVLASDSTNKIENLMPFGNIRAFKERVFKRGTWETTIRIILGYYIEMEDFIKEIDATCKYRDWVAKIEEFKTDQKKMFRTSKGIQTLDIYSIGELKFTDPCEIDFLRSILV